MVVDTEIKILREEILKLKQELNFYKQQSKRIDALIGKDISNSINQNKLETIINEIEKIENKNSIDSKELEKDNFENINISSVNYHIQNLIDLKQQLKVNELQFKMEALKEEFLLKEIAMRREFDIKKSEYETRISNLSSKLELLEHKNDVFMKYEIYMKELEKYNSDLSKNINVLQDKYDRDMETGKNNMHLKVDDVKKKMLNLINVTRSHFKKLIDDHVDYNSKILLLQNTQLFDELAEQSKHLEDLQVKLKEKEKQIIELKLDLDVQKEVQILLSGNNKKLTELIKNYFDQKNNDQESSKVQKETEINLSSLKSNNEILNTGKSNLLDNKAMIKYPTLEIERKKVFIQLINLLNMETKIIYNNIKDNNNRITNDFKSFKKDY